jgi:hypothetical protein
MPLNLAGALSSAAPSLASLIGNAANGASNALHTAQSLRAALAQQARLAQQDQFQRDQRQFENDLQLSQRGALPTEVNQQTYTEPELETSGSGMFGIPVVSNARESQKSFVKRTPNPEAQGGGMRTRTPDGRDVYLPTDEEKALKAGKSIRLTAEDANTFNTTLGTKAYKEGYLMTPEHHASVLEKGIKNIEDKAVKAGRMVTITPEIASSLKPRVNLEPGSQVDREQLEGFYRIVKAGVDLDTPKSEKPDAQSILPGQQGPNGGILVFNKNTQAVEEVPVPKGSKPVMTAGQAEADKDRHIRRTELEDLRATRNAETQSRIQDKAQSTIDKLQQQEQQQHALRREYGDFLSALGAAADGGTVVLPGSKTPVTLTPARKKSLADKYKTELHNATEKAKMYNEQARKLVQSHSGETSAPLDIGTKTPAPGRRGGGRSGGIVRWGKDVAGNPVPLTQ